MTTALANKQGQLAPLRKVKPEDILERYLAEETSVQIAKSLGVTASALSYFMLKYAEDDWKSAQLVKALQAKDKAEELLNQADNALDLARGREILRAAQWDLERVCRRIYGTDQPPGAGERVSITLNIDASTQQKGEVIEVSKSHVEESKT